MDNLRKLMGQITFGFDTAGEKKEKKKQPAHQSSVVSVATTCTGDEEAGTPSSPAGVSEKGNEEGSPEVPERGTWGNPVEFVLSCLGYAVGLGNVWRFPYLCYQNGGGAFLIPFVVMLVFVGLPIFLMELAIGQYLSAGPMDVWTISPIFKGIGASMIFVNIYGSIYYNMILAWSIYYLFASWQAKLPWYDCSNSYNTPNCYTKREAQECELAGHVWYNLTCYNTTNVGPAWQNSANCSTNIYLNESTGTNNLLSDLGLAAQSVTAQPPCVNGSDFDSETKMLMEALQQRVSASEEYLNLRVLETNANMEDAEGLKWELVLVLLAAWVMCYFCVIRGIKSSGKVVYVTATFPYLVLAVLLVRGALLPNALEGIKFYIVPQWEKLATSKVWIDAAGQVFFSISVGQGGLMTFASYNKFHNNVYRDAIIVVFMDAFTSILAGFAIFSILGYLAHTLGKPVSDVVTSGSGLAFIAYPEVVTFLQPSQLWATLFFLMLITLGIDSQFAGIETIMTAVVDMFPRLRTRKPIVSLVICSLGFIFGLSMCTHTGVYWVDLISYFSSGWSLVLIAFTEAIVLSWVYGADRLMDNIEEMIGYRLHIYWWLCFKFISPILIAAILVFNMISTTPLAYGDYVLPTWAQTIGWLITTSTVILIPVFVLIKIWQSYSDHDFNGLSLFQRVSRLARPNPDRPTPPSLEVQQQSLEELLNSPTNRIGKPISGELLNSPTSGEPTSHTRCITDDEEKRQKLTGARTIKLTIKSCEHQEKGVVNGAADFKGTVL